VPFPLLEDEELGRVSEEGIRKCNCGWVVVGGVVIKDSTDWATVSVEGFL